jgi:hypothetical protein
MGAGSPTYHRLVVSWSEVLIRAGEPGRAEDALRLMDADASPSTQRQRTIGPLHLAQEANDPVAAIMLARQLVTQAEASFGQDSADASYARLDLIEVMLVPGRRVEQTELDAAVRVVAAQNSSW